MTAESAQRWTATRAIVTGAASGIGAATARRLGAAGVALALLDREPDALAAIASELGAAAYEVDVTSPIAVDDAVARVGPIDLLVNAAGITGSHAAGTCHETPDLEWERVIAVNLTGTFLLCHAVLPAMIAAGGGLIVNLASIAGIVAFPGRCAYSASKGGVLMLTRSIAVDYGGSGIRAVAICPGMIHTPMTDWRLSDPAMHEEIVARIPQGRVGQPDDIAETIALLGSGAMAYMNGAPLILDGGWTAI
ncbi:MAG: SDR family oxidoreductase [Solirubrobacterales bacterium]|nr:SDR family oxidoreductase [Solirubrobacterales bacterium]